MNESELRDFVRFQYNQIIEKDKVNQEILGELREMRQDYKELLSKFDSLTQRLEKADLEIRDLKEQNGVLKNKLYRNMAAEGSLQSAIYNTFIETCKQAKISFQQFFCKYLAELKKGRTDYENLLPMTICLKS